MLPSTKPSKGVNPAPNFVPTWNDIQSGFKKYSRPPPRQNNGAKKPSPGTATLHELAQKEKNADLRDAGFDDNYGIGAVVSSEQQQEGGNSSARKERERENRMLRNKILGRRNKTTKTGKDWKREESSDEEEGRSGLGRAKKRKREAVAVVEQEDTGDDKNDNNGEGNVEKDDVPMEEAQIGSKQEVKADKSFDASNEEAANEGAAAVAAEEEPGQKRGETTLAKDDDEWNGIADQPIEDAKSKKKRKKKKKSKSSEVPS